MALPAPAHVTATPDPRSFRDALARFATGVAFVPIAWMVRAKSSSSSTAEPRAAASVSAQVSSNVSGSASNSRMRFARWCWMIRV